MNSIAYGFARSPDPGKALANAWRRLAVRLAVAGRPAQPPSVSAGVPAGATQAEIRRRLARDVPAWLRRDLGLDPDVL